MGLMRMTPSKFKPPFLLRNAHVQTVLAGSTFRRKAGESRLKRSAADIQPQTLTLADGVRLQGYMYTPKNVAAKALVVLVHGWEGSHESSYIRHASAELIGKGFGVFQLNLRDHGESHHLNADIFHSCRIDEVVEAFVQIAHKYPDLPLGALGFSLGGNFVLRVALRAPAHGLRLQHAAAICPVLDGASGLRALESGIGLYHWYFMQKWRRSLRKKRELFPDQHNFNEDVLDLDMRALTAWLVERHTAFTSLQDYFEGYSIGGERLRELQVPVSILTAADDPVIPVEDFHKLSLPEHCHLEISPYGGHCGFVEALHTSSFAELWAVSRLEAALLLSPISAK